MTIGLTWRRNRSQNQAFERRLFFKPSSPDYSDRPTPDFFGALPVGILCKTRNILIFLRAIS